MMLIYVLKQLRQGNCIGVGYFKTILRTIELVESAGEDLENEPEGGEVRALEPNLQVILGDDD